MPKAVEGAHLPDTHYGYGIIRPYSALTADIPAGPAQGPLANPEAAGSSAPSGAPQGLPPGPVTNVAGGARHGSGLLVGALVAGAGLLLIVLIIVVVASRRRCPQPAPVQSLFIGTGAMEAASVNSGRNGSLLQRGCAHRRPG